MTRTELLSLAERLGRYGDNDRDKAAAILRKLAELRPVAYCDPVALAGLRGETCLAVTLYAAPTGYASKPLYLAPPTAPTDAEWQEEAMRLREQLACVRQALPEALRDSVPSVAVATMTAGMEYDAALLRHALDALEYHRDQTRPIVLSDAAIAALRAHIATQPQGDEWIACSERLPEPSQDISFYSDDLRNPVSMLIGRYIDGSFMSCGFEMVNVTHWRPLPAPPTKKEQP